jgi:hypothetical protein
MVGLHRTRYAPHVNVFLGTACFPAAPQGEISIFHGHIGHSKTFMGDGGAFVQAVDYAVFLLDLRIVDQVLVGAVEAATSPWLLEQLGTPPLEAAAGFLLLGRAPAPTCRPRITAEVQESGAVDLGSWEPLDRYPVDTAARFIRRLDDALLWAPSQIAISLPRESRQLVFQIG